MKDLMWALVRPLSPTGQRCLSYALVLIAMLLGAAFCIAGDF